jgi:hypothetical protein
MILVDRSIFTIMSRIHRKLKNSNISERKKPGGGLTDMGALRRVDQSSWMAKVRSALGDVDGSVDDAAVQLDISPRRLYDYLDDEPSLEKTKQRYQQEDEKDEEKDAKKTKKEESHKLTLSALRSIINEEYKKVFIKELKLGVATGTPVMGLRTGGEPPMPVGEPVDVSDLTDANIPEFLALNNELPDHYAFDGDTLFALDADDEEMAYWDARSNKWIDVMEYNPPHI